MLDTGAGRGPYSKLFKQAHYEAADFAQFAERHTPLDYVCGHHLPFRVEDTGFDAIVCNEVLEHLPDPPPPSCANSMGSCRTMAACCPAVLSRALEALYDFFRYTPFGLPVNRFA